MTTKPSSSIGNNAPPTTTILQRSLSYMTAHITKRYTYLREKIGKRLILQGFVRKYLPHPTSEDYLVQWSRMVSEQSGQMGEKILKRKVAVNVIPEDLCLIIAANVMTPILMCLVITGWWIWIMEGIVCILYPMLVSFAALESENFDLASNMLTYWVLLGGMARMFETVFHLRYFFPRLYIPLKCLTALFLTHPKLRVGSLLTQRIIKPYIIPRLGLEGANNDNKAAANDKEMPSIEENVTTAVTTPVDSNNNDVGVAKGTPVGNSGDSSMKSNQLSDSEFSYVDVAADAALLKEAQAEAATVSESIPETKIDEKETAAVDAAEEEAEAEEEATTEADEEAAAEEETATTEAGEKATVEAEKEAAEAKTKVAEEEKQASIEASPKAEEESVAKEAATTIEEERAAHEAAQATHDAAQVAHEKAQAKAAEELRLANEAIAAAIATIGSNEESIITTESASDDKEETAPQTETTEDKEETATNTAINEESIPTSPNNDESKDGDELHVVSDDEGEASNDKVADKSVDTSNDAVTPAP